MAEEPVMSELFSGCQQGKLQESCAGEAILAHRGAKLSVWAAVICNVVAFKGASKQGLTGNAILQRLRKALSKGPKTDLIA
jgi:hypothetical protein